MSQSAREDAVIGELPNQVEWALGFDGMEAEDPSSFLRGLRLAVALSVPVWIGVIWVLSRIG